jgi:hypothetical protein
LSFDEDALEFDGVVVEKSKTPILMHRILIDIRLIISLALLVSTRSVGYLCNNRFYAAKIEEKFTTH